MNLFAGLETFLELLPGAFTLFVSIYYITRRVGTDSIFMLIGSALSMIMAIVWIVVWPKLLDGDGGPPDYAQIEVFNRVLRFGTTLSRLLFITGVFLLVLKHVARSRDAAPPSFN